MRRIAVSVLSLGLLLGAPAAVLAAAPSNNTYAGRTVIGVIPFNDTVDTTQANTGGNDALINTPDCGAPATDASVWYELTATSDDNLVVDVSTSDYSAGVIVATGSPAAGFVLVTCGPGQVFFPASNGETYTMLAFDDQSDGIGNGGTLNFSVTVQPPPPTLDMTVDPIGTVDTKTNLVTVTGTLSCSSPTGVQFFGEVRQRAGRQYVVGNLFGDESCQDVVSWSATTDSFSSGVFVGGKATVHLFAFPFPEGGGGGTPAKASGPGGYGIASPSAVGGEGFEITAQIRLKVTH
jgi:hypothetical protein